MKFFYWFFYKKSNFSQSDEEQVLNELFNKTQKGFYVDVGCHHPRRYSNTALLYNKGWHGVNIDADKKNLKFHLKHYHQNSKILIYQIYQKLKLEYFYLFF